MLKFNRRNKHLVIPVGINPNYGIDSSTLYNTGDADIVASDVLEGKVGYGKDGKIIGTLDIQSEKEESYQEGYEFGYNEGNEAGYQLGYNEGNEAGIEIGKAEVIEGMNDATITAGTVFKGEVGYGKDGARIVGDYEFVEGFDFSEIGYSENDSNTVNRSISDDIAYSKSLADQWQTNKHIFRDNLNLIYVPMVDTSNETTLWAALAGALNISYIPLWDTSNVTEFGLFGAGIGPYNNIKMLPLWNTSNVTTMSFMCSGLSNISSVPLWDTSKVTNMESMFYNCKLLTSVPLFDTSNVTRMYYMFRNCENLTSVPAFDTSNVTNMYYMFNNCKLLTSVPLFDTSNVTTIEGMFTGCSKLTSVPLFDTSNVTSMYGTFNNCKSLTSVPQFDTSNVTTMSTMFYHCYELTTIPLFDTSKISSFQSVFTYCYDLTYVGGFKNLGMSFTGTYNHGPSLTSSTKLTRQSCLNIFNNVYDMNLNTSYTGTPTIQLSSTTKALLSSDDIAIATSKGWTVS